MRKILVSDYDQTFYLNDQDIIKNKEAVSKFIDDGNLFIIATGRSYGDFKEKLDIYHFPYDYVILNHGATILDKDDNVLANFEIDDSIISSIKESLELETTTNYFCCSRLASRVEFEHGNLTKIQARYITKEKAVEMNQMINEKYSQYVNCYCVSKSAIEIVAKDINKAVAIELLVNKLQLNKQNIYTIGDGYSDIEMIKNYNGYCMDESVEELKAVAQSYPSIYLLIEDILNNKV